MVPCIFREEHACFRSLSLSLSFLFLDQVFILFWPCKSYSLFLFCPNFLFFLTKNQSRSQCRHQLLLIWWVLVNLISKVSHGWIRNLGFNSCLYRKLIGVSIIIRSGRHKLNSIIIKLSFIRLPKRLKRHFSSYKQLIIESVLATILKSENLYGTLNLNFSFPILRAFTLAHAKAIVYFGIKTYFFYFTYLLFKTPHIILFILHYISLKYQFSFFFF